MELDPLAPCIGILILIASNILISHKIRVAHRLAYYQKYFIEPIMPGIHWAEIDFKYREAFRTKHRIFYINICERFNLVQNAILIGAQLIYGYIISYLVAHNYILCQCLPPTGTLIALIFTLFFFLFQFFLLREINNFKNIEDVFMELKITHDSKYFIKSSDSSSLNNFKGPEEE